MIYFYKHNKTILITVAVIFMIISAKFLKMAQYSALITLIAGVIMGWVLKDLPKRLLLWRFGMSVKTYLADVRDPNAANHYYIGTSTAYMTNATLFTDQTPVETIVYCALRHESGLIFVADRPDRHRHLIMFMGKMGFSYTDDSCEQGFMTSHHYFVDRTNAARIALRAGQVKTIKNGIRLTSEELWDDPS